MSKTVKIARRETCRACDGALEDLIDFGEQYIINFGDKPSEKAPLVLTKCNSCHLVQLRDTVDPEFLFRHYYYKSGVNATMRDHLRGIVEDVTKRVTLKEGDVVVDIGSNDGTLLSYYPNNLKRVGFEPSAEGFRYHVEDTKKPLGAKSIVVPEFFNYDDWLRIPDLYPNQAKIISAISMFYDLNDPNAFLQDIKKVLAPDGLFVIQMNYLPAMLENNAVDNICVKPDTLILGDNKPITNYTLGNWAYGQNGMRNSTGSLQTRDYSGDMLRIKAAYLQEIVTTPEHPIRVVPRENIKFESLQMKKIVTLSPTWKKANEVKRGDYVLIPRLSESVVSCLDLSEYNKLDSKGYRRGLKKIVLDENFAWFLGLFVAEGHTGKLGAGNEYLSFTLNIKETDLIERLSTIARTLGYKIATYPRGNAVYVNMYCSALARALPNWVGRGATNKHIPDFVMQNMELIRVAFLKGVFAGDGYFKGSKVHLHTASKILALQTQLLLASLGAMVGISHAEPSTHESNGKVVRSKESWQLRGTSQRLSQIFGLPEGRTERHYFVAPEFVVVPVTKTSTETYNGKVYNISTGDDTYLVSNAVVHNCHEHLTYYSLYTLDALLVKNGLEIVDYSFNDLNGGSFRVYVKHSSNPQHADFPEEGKLMLHTLAPYKAFRDRVAEIAYRLQTFIPMEKMEGRTTYIYGASTRGATLLQYAGLDEKAIPYAVERNPDKVGTMYLGKIPVISEEQARKNPPYYYLALPWAFRGEFLDREWTHITNSGAMIFPLPQFRIVKGTEA